MPERNVNITRPSGRNPACVRPVMANGSSWTSHVLPSSREYALMPGNPSPRPSRANSTSRPSFKVSKTGFAQAVPMLEEMPEAPSEMPRWLRDPPSGRIPTVLLSVPSQGLPPGYHEPTTSHEPSGEFMDAAGDNGRMPSGLRRVEFADLLPAPASILAAKQRRQPHGAVDVGQQKQGAVVQHLKSRAVDSGQRQNNGRLPCPAEVLAAANEQPASPAMLTAVVVRHDQRSFPNSHDFRKAEPDRRIAGDGDVPSGMGAPGRTHRLESKPAVGSHGRILFRQRMWSDRLSLGPRRLLHDDVAKPRRSGMLFDAQRVDGVDLRIDRCRVDQQEPSIVSATAGPNRRRSVLEIDGHLEIARRPGPGEVAEVVEIPDAGPYR